MVSQLGYQHMGIDYPQPDAAKAAAQEDEAEPEEQQSLL